MAGCFIELQVIIKRCTCRFIDSNCDELIDVMLLQWVLKNSLMKGEYGGTKDILQKTEKPTGFDVAMTL